MLEILFSDKRVSELRSEKPERGTSYGNCLAHGEQVGSGRSWVIGQEEAENQLTSPNCRLARDPEVPEVSGCPSEIFQRHQLPWEFVLAGLLLYLGFFIIAVLDNYTQAFMGRAFK